MIDIVDCQEQLEVVFVDTPAVFRAPVGHNPQHRQVMLIMERQHPVIEQIGGGDRRLGGVELSMRHLAIGVDIERVLAAQTARMGRLDLTAGVRREGGLACHFVSAQLSVTAFE